MLLDLNQIPYQREFGVRNSEFGVRSMPYGQAESNDLLRNRERSIRAREKLRNGVMIFFSNYGR